MLTMLTLHQCPKIMSEHNVLTDFSGNLQPDTRIIVTHTFQTQITKYTLWGHRGKDSWIYLCWIRFRLISEYNKRPNVTLFMQIWVSGDSTMMCLWATSIGAAWHARVKCKPELSVAFITMNREQSQTQAHLCKDTRSYAAICVKLWKSKHLLLSCTHTHTHTHTHTMADVASGWLVKSRDLWIVRTMISGGWQQRKTTGRQKLTSVFQNALRVLLIVKHQWVTQYTQLE